jgi:hypothetical protein
MWNIHSPICITVDVGTTHEGLHQNVFCLILIIYHSMIHYACGGASLDAKATTDSKIFRKTDGIPGLLAALSNSRRSSPNMLRVYGFRREEYRSVKKW